MWPDEDRPIDTRKFPCVYLVEVQSRRRVDSEEGSFLWEPVQPVIHADPGPIYSEAYTHQRVTGDGNPVSEKGETTTFTAFEFGVAKRRGLVTARAAVVAGGVIHGGTRSRGGARSGSGGHFSKEAPLRGL